MLQTETSIATSACTTIHELSQLFRRLSDDYERTYVVAPGLPILSSSAGYPVKAVSGNICADIACPNIEYSAENPTAATGLAITL